MASLPRHTRTQLRRTVGVVRQRWATVLVAVLALAFAGGAAAPDEVAPSLNERGYYIEVGSDATDAVVGRAVSDGRSAGGLLYIVVLAVEPSSGATTYADAVLDRLPRQEGTVLVVAPETVGWSANNDIWSPEELNRALDASLDGDTSNDVVTVFVATLTEPGGAGVSGWFVLVIILGGVAVVGFFVWRSTRARSQRSAAAFDDLTAKAQRQIDALANDILEDEDEVREAHNDAASDHFDQAAAIYRDAGDRLASATTAQDVLEVSTDVDAGIWHLDAAEAILDGRPIPPKPEPPSPPKDPAGDLAGGSSSPSSASSLPPLPSYERRSSRSSGFGADDMLKSVLAMQAMRTVVGGRSRSSGRSSTRGSSRRSSGGRPSSGRSRGGGRRRG